jgi:protein-serine/threonine kinase
MGGDIRKGWASIKEDSLKTLGLWSKKYLVLRELSLDFHKNEQPGTSAGLSIPLRDIVSVNRVELKPYCIEVVRTLGNNQGANAAADAPRRTVWISLKSDPELYAWMDDVYSRCPSMGGVSNPTGFTHKVHVGFDPVSGGFTGLPDEWSKLLNNSAITKEDYQKNPQAVIEVLEFYTEGQQRLQDPNDYPIPAPLQQRTPFSPPSTAGGVQRPTAPQRQDSDTWERAAREEERQRALAAREKEEAAERKRELERQERREAERREREQEENLFNQSLQAEEEDELPQKQSSAQTPIMVSGGGGGGFSSSSARNPMAKTTKAPTKAPNNLNPQRAAPKAPAQQPLRVGASKPEAARAQDQKPAAVKPLNVPNKTQAKEVQAREQRKENKRISNMTEAQVMEKLRSVVSSGDPNQSYTKIKKVGQGASGSVYVAKINSSPASQTARDLLSRPGKSTPRVAIKQMDLAHQPRKELIVNEILVMKESQHPNIVNFLDAFLKGTAELWVVMEYMEGGALTDVIDNNNLKEDQISTICFEVRMFGCRLVNAPLTLDYRPARDSSICTSRTSFTVTSSLTTFSSTPRATSRSVRISLSSMVEILTS